MLNKVPRVLIAKIGLDGHDRGAKIISRTLRDAGFEVIYSGLHQTSKQIIRTAIQEDVDAVGISILSGAHLQHFSNLLDESKRMSLEKVLYFAGGVIPEEDHSELLGLGISRIFTAGSKLDDIVQWLQDSLKSS
jgi:methylmalonyl-CoA mutase C-terminal domain/subunit